jgi:ABC-type multidrug transport system fused ATPase/permease subunit
MWACSGCATGSVGSRSENRRSDRPRRSSASSSWAMNVSDSRGYPFRTTAIEPAACAAGGRAAGGAGTKTSVSDASFRIGRCYHRRAALTALPLPRVASYRAPDPYRMDRSLFRYILRHTWRSQAFLLVLTCISFPLIYINLELPKRIVNNAIQGKNIPETWFGIPVTQVSYLMALSLLLLALITINGGLKYWINVYSGVVGERTLRRMRHDLYQQVLRFPLAQFKTMSAGEIIPMIVAETEPVGGFIGEAIVLPIFQGGLLVTYLVFIFNQDLWLGLAAIALYPPQVYLIPRLQRKINLLAKERVQTARQLSDRIGESVAGFAEIRSNDTIALERADISHRLGRIYAIRYDIYKRKFFVKFLNNFLAQITPFFFYSVGGYLVIKGSLSLGALVAVLAAYKDILSPWKELLAWYSTKEDVRIKHEQIVSQFDPPGMFDPKLLEDPPLAIPKLAGEIAAAGLTYSENGVANKVERLTFRIAAGEHVAVVGTGYSGKEDLAQLIARLNLPTGGRLSVAGVLFNDVHQSVPGRRIAYAAQNAHVFSGTLAHNLYYGLKHAPVQPFAYDDEGARLREQNLRDALASGNSPDDVRADWIDYATAGVAGDGELAALAIRVLGLVDMERAVIGYGLAGTVDPHADPYFAAKAVAARTKLRERAERDCLEACVEFFDRDAYFANMSIAENILFGTPRNPDFQPARLADNPEVVALLRDVGLLEELQEAGAKVAGLMVEIFADVAPDSELFEQYSFISAEDLPEFRALVSKYNQGRMAAISERDKARLLALTFRLVKSRHRLGILDESMPRRIVQARNEFTRRFAGRDDICEFFHPDRYSAALSVQDNLLFGRVALDQANAQARISALVRDVASEEGLNEALVRLGLLFDVGSNGSRLSYSERQRLVIARGLMKNPDILVFNEPTSGLDPATELRVLRAVLAWAKGRTVLWTLSRAELAREFDRVLVFADGQLVEEGSFAELERDGKALASLVA